MSEVQTKLDNLYVVGGRLGGQNEDEISMVYSEQGLGHAKKVFLNGLLEMVKRDGGEAKANEYVERKLMFISFARPATMMMKTAMVAPEADDLAHLSFQDEEMIVPYMGLADD